MVEKTKSAVAGYEWEPITVGPSDFNSAEDTDVITVSAGEVGEIMRSEISEDGQLASYDILRLGQNLDAGNANSAKGKIFLNLSDDTDTEIDQRTEVRFVARPKNDNRRVALTNWHPLRNLNIDRPDHRMPLTPVTKEGKPAYVKEGRILAIEIRNQAADVTVNVSNADMDVPARAGY